MTLSVVSPLEQVNSDAAPVSAVERRKTTLQQLLSLGQSATGAETLQTQARDRLADLAIPSTKLEAWRFTDLTLLLDRSFVAAPATAEADFVEPLLLADVPLRAVFMDGQFQPALSSTEWPEGLSLTVGFDAAIAQNLLADDLFATLNTAGFSQAAVIRVAAGAAIAQPLHLLWISSSTSDTAFSQPRALIELGANSALTVIEDFAPLGNDCTADYFVNAVTEIQLGANAQLQHSRVQRDGDRAVHIGTTAVQQERDSRYHGITISTGAQLSRHNYLAAQNGSQAETILDGLSLADGDRLVDTHSGIFFNQPHGRSQQLHKCIASDRGRAVFSGRVVVPQIAQQTDAAQLSRNLLLSSRARIDAKPQLEIVADDVKCSHGATVSQLSEDEIFYLQSRGLDQAAATHLLIEAFAGEILQKLPSAQLREALSRCVSCRAERPESSSAS
ncbi:Fe-S cluster assembly protein SufD [Synechococcus elongatus IITB4]|uniref:Fe-S cluster assembly protein SufD n=1 Tax=Synechococcus elongatus TaxID=32046 RepID=UPI0030CB3FE9